jgi:hypothetical protein
MEAVRCAESAVGCELLSAARALRSAQGVRVGAPLAAVLERCSGLGELPDDHPLIDEVESSVAVLQALSDFA